MKIIQESWTCFKYIGTGCNVVERLDSFTSPLPGRPSDRKHNRSACFSCSFHERLFVRFAFAEDVQRPAVQLSSRIRRALWDAAAVTCGLFAFGAVVWQIISSFFPLLCLRRVNKPSAAEIDPTPLPVRERKAWELLCPTPGPETRT